MPKRKGSKSKKRTGKLKKFKLETETELENALEEHTRDITKVIEEEEEQEREQQRRLKSKQHEEDEEEDEVQQEKGAVTAAYKELLSAFGSSLSEKIKKRKEQLKAQNRKRFEMMQAQARAEAEALRGSDEEDGEDLENGASEEEAEFEEEEGDEAEEGEAGEEGEAEEEGNEEEAEVEEGDEEDEDAEGEENGEEEDEEDVEGEAEEGDEAEEGEEAEAGEEGEAKEAGDEEIPLEEAEEREDETDVNDADLQLIGVEEEVVGDPFRHCFASHLELAQDMEKTFTLHKDEVLGLVQTKLSNATRKKVMPPTKKDAKATFPPHFGSRPRTSHSESEPAHSLIERFKMKRRLAEQWETYVGTVKGEEKGLRSGGVFTPLQEALFPIFNEYIDLYHCARTSQNANEIRSLYMLHAINHTLKTRDSILKNNAKFNVASEEKKVLLNLQDQGYVRPKVLILVPFRNSAFEVIKTLLRLVPKVQQEQVMNKKKFYAEFGVEEETINPNKPQDYLDIMTGNVDDCFRMGISLTKKTIKLYEEFYHSDIIIASPLGLRVIVGAPGENRRDYDFLSSIEMLIMDQADIFQMQNFDHISVLMDVMNTTPKSDHGCDFSRIRTWYLNGWAKHFRQTLIFSSVPTALLHGIMNRKCCNKQGIVKIATKQAGTIAHVVPKVRQVFQRIDCPLEKVDDYRFNMFMKKIFPHLKASILKHVFIYVPSYFDYVRLRNALKEDPDEPSVSLICEYTSNSNVARARSFFFHGKRDFMLYTERFHFFRRYKIRGIRNVIFYGLPQYPQFYPELLNLLTETDQDVATVTALYTKFDIYQLQGIVGDDRAKIMINSDKDTHMFC